MSLSAHLPASTSVTDHRLRRRNDRAALCARFETEEQRVVSDSGNGVGGEASGDEIIVDEGVRITDRPRPKKRPSSAEPTACNDCGAPLSVISIDFDGRTLLMESCDGCDTRRWQLAGERIDLQEALYQVGEHAGRRRSDV